MERKGPQEGDAGATEARETEAHHADEAPVEELTAAHADGYRIGSHERLGGR